MAVRSIRNPIPPAPMVVVGAMWVLQGLLVTYAALSGATVGSGLPQCVQSSSGSILLAGVLFAFAGICAWSRSDRLLFVFGAVCWMRMGLSAVDFANLVESGYWVDPLSVASPVFEFITCGISLLVARETAS